MTTLQKIKQVFFSDVFDPCDLTQMDPPERFRSGRFDVDTSQPNDPFSGFRDSMETLGNALKRGIEIHGEKRQ